MLALQTLSLTAGAAQPLLCNVELGFDVHLSDHTLDITCVMNVEL